MYSAVICLLFFKAVVVATHVNVSIAQESSLITGHTKSESKPRISDIVIVKNDTAKAVEINNREIQFPRHKQILSERKHPYNRELDQPEQCNSKFKNQDDQARQNQDFERNIQTYHNGATVETIFESANPSAPLHQQAPVSNVPSYLKSEAQRIINIGSLPFTKQHFERQLTLTTAATTSAHDSENEAKLQKKNNSQEQSIYDPILPQLEQRHFETEPNYDDTKYESKNLNYDHTQAKNIRAHLTAYRRPVVTKTIQIAQPALKAKKFEIHHPAVKKEFYDIEERVPIRPAGTIVVELEHPVAKIPKGETILPLGHPHPAVASSYSTHGNGVTQTQFATGTVTNPDVPGNMPYHNYKRPAFSNTTLASAIRTTPIYDQTTKDVFITANLNKNFNTEAHQYTTTTQHNQIEESQSSDENFSTSDQHIPVSPIQSVYPKDEPDFQHSSTAKTNKINICKRNDNAESRTRVYVFNPHQYQTNLETNNSLHKPDNIINEPSKNENKLRSARLQEVTTDLIQSSSMNFLKQEHNILNSPSQDNIYLNSMKYNESHVKDINRYLQTHKVPIVTYTPLVSALQQRNHNIEQTNQLKKNQNSQSESQYDSITERVQYSTPYSQMRYDPGEIKNQVPIFADGDTNDEHLLLKDEVSKEEKSNEGKELINSEKQPQTHLHIEDHENHREKDAYLIMSSTSMEQSNSELKRTYLNLFPNNGAISEAVVNKNYPANIYISVKSTADHDTPGSHVIAATPAPTDSSAASECFHKRRIVVNHPFQTVHEVVEHEPITNYHQFQVIERASPALYQSAYY